MGDSYGQNFRFEWKVEPVLPRYVFRYIRFYNRDETYDQYQIESGSCRNVGYVRCVAYFWVPYVTVTFDPNGGQVSPTTKEVVVNDPYGILPVPTYAGHTFLGWYTSLGSRGTLVTAETVCTKNYDHTVYAKWETNKVEVTVIPYDRKGHKYLEFGTAPVGSYFFYPSSDQREETEDCGQQGTKHKYIFRMDAGSYSYLYVYDSGTKYRLKEITKDGSMYDNGDTFYPYADTEMIVNFEGNHEFTYLPMYDADSGILLRGVRNVLVIRDGDEE